MSISHPSDRGIIKPPQNLPKFRSQTMRVAPSDGSTLVILNPADAPIALRRWLLEFLAPLGACAPVLFFMSILTGASAILISAIDPSYPTVILALISAAGSIGGWVGSYVKGKSTERKTALLNEVNLEVMHTRYAELESQFAEHKKDSKCAHAEMRKDLETYADRVKNLEHENGELRSRLSTHVSLITEVGLQLKAEGITSARIETLFAEWHQGQRRTWTSGDTP